MNVHEWVEAVEGKKDGCAPSPSFHLLFCELPVSMIESPDRKKSYVLSVKVNFLPRNKIQQRRLTAICFLKFFISLSRATNRSDFFLHSSSAAKQASYKKDTKHVLFFLKCLRLTYTRGVFKTLSNINDGNFYKHS